MITRFQMRNALFWAITQRAVIITYRRLGTIYPPHLEDGQPMNMGPKRPETSVCNYNYTLRNSSEERRSQLHRGGSLKFHF